MTTNNHPAHGPVSLERLHQISEILSKAAAQSDGGNLGYAMADAVKVIDMAIAAFGAEPAGYADPQAFVNFKSMGGKNAACTKEWMWRDPYNGLIPLYTTPPAPEPMKDHQIRELVNDLRDITVEYHGTQQLRERIARTVRAAMIQAGNHTEQHLDMVDHSGDDNEKADCKLPFDQWLSQQNEPIDVDCGCVTTEAFYHWLRVAYEAGSSPVTPDDVLRMDWLVSKTVDVREPMVYGSHSIFWSQTITDEDDDYHATKLREQIDAAMAAEQAAAPQQENV
ncbi:hypothetical protein [Citrobacter freundii]|uniref:hypothetical protein n=1 Tax=Citrobacter freundii TaxID=546 RepID=UPI0023B0CE39|nr:hypothetical protein [Citrobacter freundii]